MKELLLYSLVLLSFSFLSPTSPASSEWVFKKERSGIKVFTRDVQGSNLKELKITLQVEATLSSIATLIADVPAYQNWVYKCALSRPLQKIDDENSIEYFLIDFPWPMSDRDLVTRSVLKQDSISKVLTSVTIGNAQLHPMQPDFIRITDHINTWTFTPVDEQRVDVVYTLKAHPAGSIPNWLINMVLDQGPVQSMLRFRDLLKHPDYINKSYPGVVNY